MLKFVTSFLKIILIAGIAQAAEVDQGSRVWQAVGRLDLDGRGFCTGVLIAPDMVLTAAHCMYDKTTGRGIAPARIVFQAGWREGEAVASRRVRQAALHPDYAYDSQDWMSRVPHDLALLELRIPIRRARVAPLEIGDAPRAGDGITVVRYAHGHQQAPLIQDDCRVNRRYGGVLITDCKADFGSSGAPVFAAGYAGPKIVSIISAMAKMEGRNVTLGMVLGAQIDVLRREMQAGHVISERARAATGNR